MRNPWLRVLLAVAALAILPTTLHASEPTQYVVVILNVETEGIHVAQKEARIRSVQDAVIASLPANQWSTVYRYRRIAALTGRGTPQALRQLQLDPRVVSLGPDHRIRAAAEQALPWVGSTTAFEQYGLTGEGVTVAIFDSGIDTDHADFSGRIIAGGSFLNQGNTSDVIEDMNGHGTNVAGILGSAGVVSAPGVARGANLLVYRVLDANSAGWVSDWAAAADDAAVMDDETLRVSNSSLVSYDLFSNCPCIEGEGAPAWAILAREGYANLEAAGVLNFACSGNGASRDGMPLPACLSSVRAVGAVYDADYGTEPDSGTYGGIWSSFGNCADDETAPDMVTCFTNINACLDFLGPGSKMTSSGPGGGLDLFTGTSQAAPVVAGAAVLLVQASPTSPSSLIEEVLAESAVLVDLPPEFPGQRPRVDIHGALDMILCGNGVVDDGESCDWAIPGAAGCCSDECVAAEEGAECSDDVFCTLGDACEEGLCVPGNDTPCPFNPAVCALVVCVEDTQECTSSPISGLLPCDDGLFCTVDEDCSTGNCSGSPRDCSFLDGDGVIGVCSEEEDACVAEAVVADPGSSADAGSDTDATSSDTTEDAIEDVVSDVADDVAPDVADDVAPDVGEDVIADVADDVAPDVADDIAPDVADDIAPDVADDIAPDVADDVAPDVADDVAPDMADDIAPDVAEDVGSDTVDDVADMVDSAAEGPQGSDPASCGCDLRSARTPWSEPGVLGTFVFALLAVARRRIRV